MQAHHDLNRLVEKVVYALPILSKIESHEDIYLQCFAAINKAVNQSTSLASFSSDIAQTASKTLFVNLCH